MALWATMSLDRKESGDVEAPSFMEVFFRFSKFVVRFVVASLIVSFIAEPLWGHAAIKAIGKACVVFILKNKYYLYGQKTNGKSCWIAALNMPKT